MCLQSKIMRVAGEALVEVSGAEACAGTRVDAIEIAVEVEAEEEFTARAAGTEG